MSNDNRKDMHKYHVVICAVLFGCDDSFVGLDLGKGLGITRKSLHPKDRLNDIFGVDAMELRREYECARLDETTLDVACIFHEYDFFDEISSPESYYDTISSEMCTYLDDQVRALRLHVEGPVRYKKLAINMHCEPCRIGETSTSSSYISIMPIGEAYNVHTIKKAHYDSVGSLRDKMNKITFPIQVNYLHQCHLLYDRSYLVTLQEAEVLLITCLEVLFVKAEQGKREQLAKRCAIFLFDSKEERLECYKELCSQYKYRSEFVHEGNASSISEKGILFLRKCVRDSLIKLLNFDRYKRKETLVCDLRREVAGLDYWGG